MKFLKAIFLTGALASCMALVACGDDPENNNTNTDPDAGVVEPTDGGTTEPPTDGGNEGGIVTSSFPAYVKSLIETQTADNTAPAAQSVWDAIPDDETAATAAALFPAAFFP